MTTSCTVQAILSGEFGAEAARVDEIIKSGPLSTVLRGQFRGQPAVFKHFTDPGGPQIVAGMQSELDRLSTCLDAGPYRVNKCLATVPEAGLIVLSHVPGQRVSTVLKQDAEDTRRMVLALCGGWLKTCAGLRQEMRPMRPNRHLKKLASIDVAGLRPVDHDLVQRMMTRLDQMSAVLARRDIAYAVAHGDFAPVNLHYEDGVIYGVDIQGGHFFALARMTARFLTGKDITSDRDVRQVWGLDADDIEAFNVNWVLGDDGSEVLPFFIGEQLVRRFVSSARRGGALARTRRRMVNFLETDQ